jgi:hypothetical protein
MTVAAEVPLRADVVVNDSAGLREPMKTQPATAGGISLVAIHPL